MHLSFTANDYFVKRKGFSDNRSCAQMGAD